MAITKEQNLPEICNFLTFQISQVSVVSAGLMTIPAAPLQVFVRGGTALPEVVFGLPLSFAWFAVTLQSHARPV